MSLEKSIGKREKRKPYYGAKAIDRTCRNHGGRGKKHDGWQCPACKANRLIQATKENERVKEQIEEINGN